MRTVIVIPARMAATRLPRKPLAELGGLPLIVRVARQAARATIPVGVWVATDDSAIGAACDAHGVRWVMTRADHPSGTDRVAQAVTAIGGAVGNADAVLNVQGDEPFIDPRDLDALAVLLATPDVEMVTLRRAITDPHELSNPNVVKVVVDDRGRALYFSRAPIPYDRDGDKDLAQCWRHIGVYGYRVPTLQTLVAAPVHPLERREKLEQLRALALGTSIATAEAMTTGTGIDTPDDLDRARARVAELGEGAFPG